MAYSTARLCLIDTIGCGLEGLRVSEECRALMEPIVPGTVVPNGTKVPGTPFQMDPVCVLPILRVGDERLTRSDSAVAARSPLALRFAGSTLTSASALFQLVRPGTRD